MALGKFIKMHSVRLKVPKFEWHFERAVKTGGVTSNVATVIKTMTCEIIR